MKIKIKKGTGLKIEGPASITFIDGKIDVHGIELRRREKVSIAKGKQITIMAVDDSILDVSLGEDGKYEELEAEPVPYEWREGVNRVIREIVASDKIVILGDANSGKSIFANYLINQLLLNEHKVIMIDTDLGQSEIGLPATISLSFFNRPVSSLTKKSLDNGFFVGEISPERVSHRTLLGLKIMLEKAYNYKPSVIVINTDGWIEGEKAVESKVGLILLSKPKFIFALQKRNELEPILWPLRTLDWLRIIRLPSYPGIRKRSFEERRLFRQGAYRKYFSTARIRVYSLNKVSILFAHIGVVYDLSQSEKEILDKNLSTEELKNIIWKASTPLSLIIVTKKRIDQNALENIERELGKKPLVLKPGFEKGVLVGLCDKNLNLKGLGSIEEIDFKRNVIKIITPIEEKPKLIIVGNIRLGEDFIEKERFDEWVI